MRTRDGRGTLDELMEALGGGVELTVGGHPASYADDVLFIELDEGVLALSLGLEDQDADPQAALTSLAELAVQRAPSLPALTPPDEVGADAPDAAPPAGVVPDVEHVYANGEVAWVVLGSDEAVATEIFAALP